MPVAPEMLPSHHPTKARASTTCRASFWRALRPRFLPRVTISRSSSRPMALKAKVTARARRSSGVRGPMTRAPAAPAAMMMTPPIVGVPDLAWCRCGASALMTCRALRARSTRMIGPPIARATASASSSGSGSRLGIRQFPDDQLELHATRRLDEERIAAPQAVLERLGGLRGVRAADDAGRGQPGPDGSFGDAGGTVADSDQEINAGLCGSLADLAVRLLRGMAQFEHVAQGRDPAAGALLQHG